MDVIKGKTWTFGKNIDTDVIIPGRYLRTFNPQDLADHVLEGERPDFTENVKKGDEINYKYDNFKKTYIIDKIEIIRDTDWSYLENTN